jgi:alcohol dehydrogenase
LEGNKNVVWADEVRENPDINHLQAMVARLAGRHFESVVAFGGGSVIDTAKILNVCLSRECAGTTLHELVKDPRRHADAKPAPLYAVPTTSGTGSEVTPFATVWNHETRSKLSLSGAAAWPTEAFVDPCLTDSVPREITISTGLDAINQAAESIWNKKASAMTSLYATRALILAFEALPKLTDGKECETARDRMAEASLLAGLAISQTRTALCHSISYPITAHFNVPHGLACAFTMNAVLRLNLRAEDGRFAQLAKALTGSSELNGLIAMFEGLTSVLKVRERVMSYVPAMQDLLELEGKMATPGRFENNLSDDVSVADIIKSSWNSTA